MKSVAGKVGRVGVRSLWTVLALTAFVANAVAQPAPTDLADFKKKFKQGCEEGHGSYIENPDGSFQCNTSGGTTIKCTDDKTPCVSIPR